MPATTEALASKSDNSTTMSFRILDLPPEIRNEIWIQVVNYSPCAFLHPRDHGRLATQSTLPRVSRQVREEFLAALYRHTEIFAVVDDFNFDHVITFFDRLRENGLNTLKTTWNSPGRSMNLDFDVSTSKNIDRRALDRWYDYMKDPTNKGSKVAIFYGVLPTTDLAVTYDWWIQEFDRFGQYDEIHDPIVQPVEDQIMDALAEFLDSVEPDELSDE